MNQTSRWRLIKSYTRLIENLVIEIQQTWDESIIQEIHHNQKLLVNLRLNKWNLQKHQLLVHTG